MVCDVAIGAACAVLVTTKCIDADRGCEALPGGSATSTSCKFATPLLLQSTAQPVLYSFARCRVAVSDRSLRVSHSCRHAAVGAAVPSVNPAQGRRGPRSAAICHKACCREVQPLPSWRSWRPDKAANNCVARTLAQMSSCGRCGPLWRRWRLRASAPRMLPCQVFFLLLQVVERLGEAGQRVTVNRGFARNHLVTATDTVYKQSL